MIDSMTLLMIGSKLIGLQSKGFHFAPFYAMLADFQADGRIPLVNDSVKRAERGSARAAEHVFTDV